MFNLVPVNRICVVMSCLEIGVGKSDEIANEKSENGYFFCLSGDIWIFYINIY